MTFKPNPGCNIPTPKDIPNVLEYLNNLPTEIAKRLIPDPTAKAQAAVDTFNKLKKDYEDAVKEKEEQLKQYAKIVCPLPNVLDKKATGRE